MDSLCLWSEAGLVCSEKDPLLVFNYVSGVVKFYLSLQQLFICEFWLNQTPPRAV